MKAHACGLKVVYEKEGIAGVKKGFLYWGRIVIRGDIGQTLTHKNWFLRWVSAALVACGGIIAIIGCEYAPTGYIYGIVYSAISGDAIESAVVESDGVEDTTDSNGRFWLTKVRTGSRAIEARKDGFETYYGQVAVTANGTKYDIELSAEDNAPEKPSLLLNSAAVEPDRIIQLLIYDHSDDEDWFIVERKIGSGTFTWLADLPTDTEIYNDGGLATSTTYTYRIKAYNDSGSSEWYEDTATTLGVLIGDVTVHPSADAYVCEASPNTNYGAEMDVQISGKAGDKHWALLCFSLPDLPDYALGYEGAELVLYDSNAGNEAYSAIGVYGALILYSWTESTVTWNNRPGVLLAVGGQPVLCQNSAGFSYVLSVQAFAC